MKLLVILLCFALERYATQLEHMRRKPWFNAWFCLLKSKAPIAEPGFLMGLSVLPITLLIWFLVKIVGAFSLAGFIFQMVVLFFCLGPDSIYPPRTETQLSAAAYFEQAYRQWFAVLFWYVALGLTGAVLYRLIDLARREVELHERSVFVLGYLDWIPARLTGALYLLVGHFQQAYKFMCEAWWSAPENNMAFLTGCGLKATQSKKAGEVDVDQAKQVVWHAMILFLVGLACLSLAAKW